MLLGPELHARGEKLARSSLNTTNPAVAQTARRSRHDAPRPRCSGSRGVAGWRACPEMLFLASSCVHSETSLNLKRHDDWTPIPDRMLGTVPTDKVISIFVPIDAPQNPPPDGCRSLSSAHVDPRSAPAGQAGLTSSQHSTPPLPRSPGKTGTITGITPATDAPRLQDNALSQRSQPLRNSD